VPFDVYATLPVLAAGVFLVAAGFVGARTADTLPRNAWLVPAFLAAAFLAWSVFTVAVEGPLGFWPNHTRDAWGNQVWFDLLLAVGAAYALVARDARRLGMQPLAWLALIACTGSIGLFAMLARWMFLRQRATVA